MRLTRLEIENFKGIGERQVIEIRPITLLFGPNSAGKTTILQAVEYLHQILQGNLLNIDEKNASKVEQGWEDFESLVHCHDLKKIIRIKADVKLNENFYDELFPINLTGKEDRDPTPLNLSKSLGDAKFVGLPINYLVGDERNSKVTDVAIAVEVAWQDAPDQFGKKMSRPFLRSLEIDINNQCIMTIRPSQPSNLPYSEVATVEVNCSHYLLNGMDSANKIEYEYTEKTNIYNLQEKKRKWSIEHGEKIGAQDDDRPGSSDSNSNDQDTESLFYKEILEVVHEIVSDIGEINSENLDKLLISNFDLVSLGDYYSGGHLDDSSVGVDISFPVNFVSKNTNERSERMIRLQAIFSEILSGSINAVSFTTQSSPASSFAPPSVIGPLRSIPQRGKSGTVLDTTDDLEFIHLVKCWLENFNLDYTIRRFKLKLVSEEAMNHSTNSRESLETEIELNSLQDYFPEISPKDQTILKLYGKRREIFLDFVDVGVGISQLVPVIVAALYVDNFGLVRIEQPELHVHPAIQIELGDLFIESAREHEGMERTFLIETHSEHLLLRLLRRIQETTDNELPPDIVGLEAEDLSVIYVEPVRTEKLIRTRIKRLRIDKTGEFEDRWPNGFFDERYGELF